jgi:hypothetical protein
VLVSYSRASEGLNRFLLCFSSAQLYAAYFCVVMFRGLLLFSLPFIVDSFCVVMFNFTFGLPLLNYLCTDAHPVAPQCVDGLLCQ